MPPFRAVILYFGSGYPRAPDLSEIHAKGRGGLQPGASRDCRPPWGTARKPTAPLGVSHGEAEKPTAPPDFSTAKRESRLRCGDFFTAKRESRPRRPEFATAKCESRQRRSDFSAAKRESRLRRLDFFTAKRESRQRRSPCPARGFFDRAAGRNGALPYNARKSQFLRNGDVWATESLFLFAVLWLAFLPDQSETGVAGGGKARRPETPAAPRRPAQRPRPAPGFCAASANARPGDPAPVRLLEKALWVPPTTEPFRPAPSGKPKGKGKEEARMKRAPPL